MFRFVLVCVCALLLVSGAVGAGPSLLPAQPAAVPVIDLGARPSILTRPPAPVATLTRASLFAGKTPQGFFAPRLRTYAGVAGLRDLIAKAEAGKAGYDAINLGAKIMPGKPPTRLTIGEIWAWMDATPGQPHAIGRYQLIPPTFKRLVRHLGLSMDQRYSPDVQDQFADALLNEAGMEEYLAGHLGQTNFMNNLAKIWAGLPNASGRSHYHGYAGNKAVISWDDFQSEMDRIFPRG